MPEAEKNEEVGEIGISSRLMAMTQSLLRKRDGAVRFRAASGIERIWLEDEKLYNGKDITQAGRGRMIDYATGDSFVQGKKMARRSRVVANIIRSKCDIAEGRFSDILMPVDDRNWGLKTTPDPELKKQLRDQSPAYQDEGPVLMQQSGQQASMAEVAQHKQKTAAEKMEGMQLVIDDQLNECGWNGECRKAIRAAVRGGVGILKGPAVIKRTQRKWVKQTDETGSVFVMEAKDDRRPASKFVDKWNVYPAPECEEDVQKSPYMWERGMILPREIRQLIGAEGYLEDQLKLVLEEEPKRTQVGMEKGGGSVINTETLDKGAAYETWEYNGDVDVDDLLAAGCSCEQAQSVSLSGSVLFINDRPVKVELNEIETGDLVYDFFTWSPIPGSPWGIGLPRIGMWQQRVIIAAWRAMMDNAGDSSGANVVVGDGIEPADDNWELTGKKLWRATGDVEDVRAAFAQFQLESRQTELAAVVDMALRFLDQETGIPTLFNGEAKTAPETLGATNIMVDANNVSLRTRVKSWDDSITRPHLTRYYHWNMKYHKDEEVKGDYCVDPRGTSVLFEKDQRAQAILQAWSLKGDPEIAELVDWKKAAKLLFQSLHLDIMKDEDEMAAQPPPQAQQAPNPQAEVAQIRVEGAIKQEEMRQQSDMAELEFKSSEADKQREHEKIMRQMELDIKVLEFSQANNVKIDAIKSQLAQTSQKLNVQVALSKDQARKEVLKPPSEPAQLAPAGRSFQE